MDARTFDQWTVAIAHRPTRRTAFRLLAGGVLGGVLAQRGLAPARAAQRPDSDGDGLFDDDETEVYGTDPGTFDTDGDGVGDGEEIYNRDQGLAGPSDPLTPEDPGLVALGGEQGEAVACSDELVNCGSACANLAFDPLHCGYCGNACPGGEGFEGVCSFGVCSLASVPVPVDGGGDANSGCDPGPMPPGCLCVSNGQCVIADAGLPCPAGLTLCNGFCVDLTNDFYNCGLCSNPCFGRDGGYCENNFCVYPCIAAGTC